MLASAAALEFSVSHRGTSVVVLIVKNRHGGVRDLCSWDIRCCTHREESSSWSEIFVRGTSVVVLIVKNHHRRVRDLCSCVSIFISAKDMLAERIYAGLRRDISRVKWFPFRVVPM